RRRLGLHGPVPDRRGSRPLRRLPVTRAMPTQAPPPTIWPIEVWRGGVAAWECDGMGHMNVRFHLQRFSEGLIGLAAALGLPRAMTAAATATLRPEVQHVRFLREARSGAPLHMGAALIDIGEATATALMVLIHSR